ncbi:MAG: hypothetical protein GF372_07915 [Candidatus Marinimicrobia bacterium]|nr:hypothetical protein [Candidatus Neomarinimicrobiota bacterium]
MKNLIRSLILGLAILCSASGHAQSSGDVPFSLLGKIEPRHACDIASSNWSVGAETMDRDYTIYEHWKDYLGPLGAKKARIQAGWAKTEPTPGVYNWAWLDEIIFDMHDQCVEPWINLSYGNPNYASGGGTRLGADMPASGEALDAWIQWIRGIVTRYGGVVDEWEIWNEGVHGGNTMELYMKLYIPTARAIRELQPKATIIAMSMAGTHPDLADEFLGNLASRDLLHLVDEISYHPYSRNPDAVYDDVADLRAAINKYSESITIRQGENGAPSEFRKTKALSNYDWTELSQAKWTLRRLLGDLGRDIPSSYFSIMDLKYPDEMNRKGLLYATEEKTVKYRKPAYHAMQNITSIFDHSLQLIPEYPYLTKNEKSLSLFAFEKQSSGQQIVIIWFDGDIPSDMNEKTSLNFTFAQGQFDDPVYVDLRTGDVFEIPKSSIEKTGTRFVFSGIPVYDSPIAISDKDLIQIAQD